MEWCCLKGCSKYAGDTEVEGGSKQESRLEEGNREGYDPKRVEE